MFLIYLAFIFSYIDTADSATVVCNNDSCVSSNNIYATIINNQIDSNVRILSYNNQSAIGGSLDFIIPDSINTNPRGMNLFLDFNLDAILLDFSSKNPNKNSSDVIVIAPILGSIKAISDGSNGINGESSTDLCDKTFNSTDKCAISITNTYNSFSCPAGYSLSPTKEINYGQSTTCNYDDNLCFINTIKDEHTEYKYYFTPTPGTKAILAGSINVFVYNYNNLIYSNAVGVYGAGGKADLSLPLDPSPIKYCWSLNSIPANNPTLTILKITYRPFIQTPDANSGLPGVLHDGTTTIIRGLDTSMRFWLGNDNTTTN